MNDIKISVVNKNLIHYRIHNNQICSKKKNIEENKLYDIEFKSEPDLNDYNIGILLEIYNKKDISIINITNKNIFENKSKFYFFYADKKITEVLKLHLKNNKINNYIIQINDSDYIDFCPYDIMKCFGVSIEINCDFLIYIENHYIPKINNLEELDEYKKYISKNIL